MTLPLEIVLVAYWAAVDVSNPLPQTVNVSGVIQAFQVLLNCSDDISDILLVY